MRSITPRGESLRRAVRFVSDALRDESDGPLGPLVQEASLRFDLSPAEADYLVRFYREATSTRAPARPDGADQAGEVGKDPDSDPTRVE